MKKYSFLKSDDAQIDESNSHYKTVKRVLERMVDSGVLALGDGYCIGTSDMIQMALKSEGIESRIIESQLTITYNTDQKDAPMLFIGFDQKNEGTMVPTHVVVITDTSPCFLIDGSIGSRLPFGKPLVLQPVGEILPTNIITEISCQADKLKMIYQEKKSKAVPVVSHMSALQRMQTDRKIFQEMQFLKTLNYIGISISVFALINVLLKITGIWTY